MRALAICVGIAALLATDIHAADQNPLVGNWRLVSNQITIDNSAPQDFPGPNPRGYLILTAEGRMMALITSGERRFGNSDADMSGLLRSMLAYSGKYRVEGSDFVTMVDVSWIEAWNGTEQRRRYSIEGDRLTIVSAPQPSLSDPAKSVVGMLVWEREK